jgi:peptidoglycan hydrolase CwlO-like protein
MNNEEKILMMLEQMQGQINSMGELMDGKLEPIKADISEMKGNIDYLQGDVSALKKDMVKHNHFVEPQLKLIHEGIEGLQERYNQVDKIENKVDDHGHRIFALEQVVKNR